MLHSNGREETIFEFHKIQKLSSRDPKLIYSSEREGAIEGWALTRRCIKKLRENRCIDLYTFTLYYIIKYELSRRNFESTSLSVPDEHTMPPHSRRPWKGSSATDHYSRSKKFSRHFELKYEYCRLRYVLVKYDSTSIQDPIVNVVVRNFIARKNIHVYTSRRAFAKAGANSRVRSTS